MIKPKVLLNLVFAFDLYETVFAEFLFLNPIECGLVLELGWVLEPIPFEVFRFVVILQGFVTDDEYFVVVAFIVDFWALDMESGKGITF